jgi:uncharacterized protein
MTPDERQILSHFLNDLVQARSGPKDPEAAQMIDQALRANPDGAYLLVQHAVIADQALHDAQAQQAQGGGGFFGGAGAGGPWGARQAQPGYAQPGYNPGGYVPQTYAQPAQAQPQPQGGMFGGGGGLGSFLRQAGTMAAGVAAGDMLFSGLSGMFGGGRGGFGGGYGGGGVENVTINNYGDDSDDDGGSGDYSDDGGDDS